MLNIPNAVEQELQGHPAICARCTRICTPGKQKVDDVSYAAIPAFDDSVIKWSRVVLDRCMRIGPFIEKKADSL